MATMSEGSRCIESTGLENITLTRRQNALILFQAFAERALAAGGSPKGLEQSFAASLQISPSMWSQIKSSRPIGDKLARQIEQLGRQPRGWLDAARDPSDAVSPAEKSFLELALAAWRASSRADRRALRAQLASAVDAAAASRDQPPPPAQGDRPALRKPPA